MTCAYQITQNEHGEQVIDLHIDTFNHHPIPPGFVVCDWTQLREMWRAKDSLAIERMRKEALCRSSSQRSGSSARPR
jgi:hypothetical protein